MTVEEIISAKMLVPSQTLADRCSRMRLPSKLMDRTLADGATRGACLTLARRLKALSRLTLDRLTPAEVERYRAASGLTGEELRTLFAPAE